MAMAFKAPPPTYKRRLYVGDHPVERLRERIKKTGTQLREKEDLRNFIDFSVSEALDLGHVEEYIDEGVPSKLVDLCEIIQDDLWAVVRPNRKYDRDEFSEVVVTLLEGWQVERSRSSDKWVFPQYSNGDEKFHIAIPEELIEKLRASDAKNQPRETNGKDISGMILILYRTKEGKQEQEEWAETEKVEPRLNELRSSQRVDSASIRVFKEIQTQIKLVL